MQVLYLFVCSFQGLQALWVAWGGTPVLPLLLLPLILVGIVASGVLDFSGLPVWFVMLLRGLFMCQCGVLWQGCSSYCWSKNTKKYYGRDWWVMGSLVYIPTSPTVDPRPTTPAPWPSIHPTLLHDGLCIICCCFLSRLQSGRKTKIAIQLFPTLISHSYITFITIHPC